MLRSRLLVAAWLVTIASAARAQVAVLPAQPLRFPAIQAQAVAVSPFDSTHRLEADLVASGTVTLSIELPLALRTGAGDGLLLRFGPGDGLITFPGSPAVLRFDPAVPLTFRIPDGSGRARLWLGGEARPVSSQRPGEYSAPVTIQLTATPER